MTYAVVILLIAGLGFVWLSLVHESTGTLAAGLTLLAIDALLALGWGMWALFT